MSDDKPKPSLKVEQRKAPDCRFVVDIFDESGRLICYCGPYNSRRDTMVCVDLFVTHGWSVGNALEVLAS